MKQTNKNHLKKLASLSLLLFLLFNVSAQVKYNKTANLDLTVSGTSTLHDWDMKSSQGSFEATFVLNNTGAISSISGLSFSTPSNALKSGHDAMDKNAYKALKIDKTASINYIATSATVTPLSTADFLVKSQGKLTIAGVTLDTEISATCKINSDKTISIMGSKKISMKEFGMAPPSFMMGTIKTGNDVTLKFDLKLVK